MELNNKKLYRSSTNKFLGGVCAGMADYFGMDPTVVRVIYTLLTVFTAFCGVLVYIILLFIIPSENDIR